eukprot:302886-Pelagomonas_calceolata.AAC.1
MYALVNHIFPAKYIHEQILPQRSKLFLTDRGNASKLWTQGFNPIHHEAESMQLFISIPICVSFNSGSSTRGAGELK